MFGWGGFDRIFVFDTESGDELSTFDGAWLITYCASGVMGFIARFGLLTWPVWLAFRRMRRIPIKSDQALIAAVAVATAMVSVDLLPNGMFTYFPHLLAGVLLGAVRQLTRRDSAPMAHVGSERPRARQVQPASV
jgi:hypothetical protein